MLSFYKPILFDSCLYIETIISKWPDIVCRNADKIRQIYFINQKQEQKCAIGVGLITDSGA